MIKNDKELIAETPCKLKTLMVRTPGNNIVFHFHSIQIYSVDIMNFKVTINVRVVSLIYYFCSRCN